MSDEQDKKEAPPPGAPPSPAAPSGPPGAAPPAPPAAAPPAPPAAAPPAPPAAEKPDPMRAEVESRGVEVLKKRFPDEVVEVSYYAGDAIVRLRKNRFTEIARVLRDDPELRFDFLSNLTAVHWPDRPQAFEVVYHLYSIPRRHRLTLKVDVAEGEETPTATSVWATANWHEREVFDLFGVRFAGHPDLTRILMTDEWVGHPLRKDYPLEGHPRDHLQLREVSTAEHVYRYDKSTIKGFGWKKEVEKTGEGHG